jgi:Uma2 family endonuclease
MADGRQANTKLTWQDYLEIPEDNSRYYELLDGELIVSPTPLLRHQSVVSRLMHFLMSWCEEQRAGQVWVAPVAVRLADTLVFEPDIVFVAHENSAILDRRGVLGPPDLVVEVRSPSTASYDRDIKRKRYLQSGVPEVWLVDPDADTVEVFRGDAPPVIARNSLHSVLAGHDILLNLEPVFRRV